MDTYNDDKIGEVLQILCEGYDPERGAYFGRSYADSPEIDGCVWFSSEKQVETGSFAAVLIDDVTDGELCGTAVEVERT